MYNFNNYVLRKDLFTMSRNNMFDDAVDKREKAQSEITANVTKKSEKEDRSMKMTLSITPQDRILVKTYAIRNNLTVSDLFHQWISEHCAE